MGKMNGMNKNYREVAGVLAKLENASGFAYDVLARMDKRTFNSVNSTLAAMATKGYVTKKKDVYNEEKMLTRYTLTEAGRAELERVEAEAEESTDTIEDITEAVATA